MHMLAHINQSATGNRSTTGKNSCVISSTKLALREILLAVFELCIAVTSLVFSKTRKLSPR
jgi:hypothetical protein